LCSYKYTNGLTSSFEVETKENVRLLVVTLTTGLTD